MRCRSVAEAIAEHGTTPMAQSKRRRARSGLPLARRSAVRSNCDVYSVVVVFSLMPDR